MADLLGGRSPQLAVGLSCDAELPDLIALAVGSVGTVRSDNDLVFYNNPVSPDGSTTWPGSSGTADWLQMDLDRVDADVSKIVVGCAGGALNATRSSSMRLVVTTLAGANLASANLIRRRETVR